MMQSSLRAQNDLTNQVAAANAEQQAATIDGVLCSLNKAALPAFSAPTTIVREDIMSHLAANATASLNDRVIEFRASISDVKMKDEKTARVSFKDPATPSFNQIKTKSLVYILHGGIDLPMDKASAMKILPGQILTLRGRITYHHCTNGPDSARFRDGVLMNLTYRGGNYQGAVITFARDSFRIDER
jgi:hypothetical protein